MFFITYTIAEVTNTYILNWILPSATLGDEEGRWIVVIYPDGADALTGDVGPCSVASHEEGKRYSDQYIFRRCRMRNSKIPGHDPNYPNDISSHQFCILARVKILRIAICLEKTLSRDVANLAEMANLPLCVRYKPLL